MKAIILPSDTKSPAVALAGAMAQIGGVPIIFHVIRMLESAGVSKIIVCDNSDSSELEELLKKSQDKIERAQIEHFRVSSDLKSAQIIEKCRKFDLENTFFVVPNDVITDLDLKKMLDFHKKEGKVATVLIAENKKYFVALGSDSTYESKIVNSEIHVFECEIVDYCEGAKRLDGEVLIRVAEDDELSIFNNGSFIQKCSSTISNTTNS
jgi:glucose-1-phosphate cytidylyltransferase